MAAAGYYNGSNNPQMDTAPPAYPMPAASGGAPERSQTSYGEYQPNSDQGGKNQQSWNTPNGSGQGYYGPPPTNQYGPPQQQQHQYGPPPPQNYGPRES